MAIVSMLYGAGGASSAEDVSYDNTTSGLEADNVQDAIDEVDGNLDYSTSETVCGTWIVNGVEKPLYRKCYYYDFQAICDGQTHSEFLDSSITSTNAIPIKIAGVVGLTQAQGKFFGHIPDFYSKDSNYLLNIELFLHPTNGFYCQYAFGPSRSQSTTIIAVLEYVKQS